MKKTTERKIFDILSFIFLLSLFFLVCALGSLILILTLPAPYNWEYFFKAMIITIIGWYVFLMYDAYVAQMKKKFEKEKEEIDEEILAIVYSCHICDTPFIEETSYCKNCGANLEDYLRRVKRVEASMNERWIDLSIKKGSDKNEEDI